MRKSVLPSHRVHSKDRTQVVSLGSRGLFLGHHLHGLKGSDLMGEKKGKGGNIKRETDLDRVSVLL